MNTAELLTLAAMSGGLFAFLAGLFQYRQAQRWKRAEFVANEMREFKADPLIRNALLMLDWNERAIELFPQEPSADKRQVRIADRMIAEALVPHVIRGEFSPVEIALRDAFDSFFDRLERFEYFMQARLVTTKQFAPYLSYWLKILGDENSGRKPPDVVRAIWAYIEFYYSGVTSLLCRFGYDIRSQARS